MAQSFFALRDTCQVTVVNKKNKSGNIVQEVWLCESEPGTPTWSKVRVGQLNSLFFELNSKNTLLNACVELPGLSGNSAVYLVQLEMHADFSTLKTMRLQQGIQQTFFIKENIPTKTFHREKFSSISLGITKHGEGMYAALYNSDDGRNTLLGMIPQIEHSDEKKANLSHVWRQILLPQLFDQTCENRLTWDGFYITGRQTESRSIKTAYFCDLSTCKQNHHDTYKIETYTLFYGPQGITSQILRISNRVNSELDPNPVRDIDKYQDNAQIPDLHTGLKYKFFSNSCFKIDEKPSGKVHNAIYKDKRWELTIEFFNESSFLQFGTSIPILPTIDKNAQIPLHFNNIHICRTDSGAFVTTLNPGFVSFDSWDSSKTTVERHKLVDQVEDSIDQLLNYHILQMYYHEQAVYIQGRPLLVNSNMNQNTLEYCLWKIDFRTSPPHIQRICSLVTPVMAKVFISDHRQVSPFLEKPSKNASLCLSAIFNQGRMFTCTCVGSNTSEARCGDVFTGIKGLNLEPFLSHIHGNQKGDYFNKSCEMGYWLEYKPS